MCGKALSAKAASKRTDVLHLGAADLQCVAGRARRLSPTSITRSTPPELLATFVARNELPQITPGDIGVCSLVRVRRVNDTDAAASRHSCRGSRSRPFGSPSTSTRSASGASAAGERRLDISSIHMVFIRPALFYITETCNDHNVSCGIPGRYCTGSIRPTSSIRCPEAPPSMRPWMGSELP